jgi:thioredoxin 1
VGNIVYVGQDNFEREVLQSNQPVLVDFYADWCGPCKALAPIIEEAASELEGRLKVAKLDVDRNEELSMRYGVQSIPTLLLFKGGQEAERIVGFLSKAQLMSRLERHLE